MTALSPAEIITASFYAWELRGRGWELAEYPVTLEPPYRPFFLLPDLYPAAEPIDEGRIPTALSLFAERITRYFTSRNVEEAKPESQEPFAEQPPFPAPPAAPAICYEIRLPPDFKAEAEVARRLLRALSAAWQPLSFEIVGQDGTVTIQVVCSEGDSPDVIGALKGYVPEASVLKEGDRLLDGWDTRQESAVVDFGLSEEFFLPLETPRSLAVDPYIALVAALSRAREDELACFQALFEPVRNPWGRAILEAVDDGEGGCIIADAPGFLKLAREKVETPPFAAVVRVAAQARTKERAWELARATGAFFRQFARPGANELIPLTNDGYPDSEHEASLLTRQSFRTGMILSAAELLGLVHLPDASVRQEALKREVKRTKPLPPQARGHAFVIGENAHQGKRELATVSTAERLQHMHILGASGTGKSTLLLQLIAQDIENGEGLAVLDPHGDLIEEILGRIPDARRDEVIVFDPADTDAPVGFNILSAGSETEKTLLASDMAGIFKRLATSWGDAMSTVLGNAVLAMLGSSSPTTLLELRRFLVEEDFRTRFLETVKDDEVHFFWQREFPLIGARSIGPILTRLNTFLRPRLIRQIVGQRAPRLQLAQVLDEGKVFLAKLSQGIIGEENAYLLGSLLVAKFHQLALARQREASANRRPFFIYADEFQHFVTPSMASLLSEARKYRVGLTLAHQTLAQLDAAPSVEAALLGNAYTRIIFRVGSHDAQKLAEGLSTFSAKDLQDLGCGEAVVRLGAATNDFNLRTFALKTVEPEIAAGTRETVIDLSRASFGTPLAEIEKEFAVLYGSHETLRAEKTAEPESAAVKLQEAHTPHPEAPAARRDDDALRSKAAQRVIARTEPPLSGRGGQEHKYLQHLVKRLGEERGFRAAIEETVGEGRVDVALRREKLALAFEISVTTEIEHELANLAKCLEAGYTRIFLVCSDKRRREKLARQIEERYKEASAVVLAPEEIVGVLDQFVSIAQPSETTVRGYKVKVNRQALSPADTAGRRSVIAEVIARSLKKPK